jgi:hypothetical protein
MMHGAGDVVHPAQDSVAVMEEILVDYLTDVVRETPSSPLSGRRAGSGSDTAAPRQCIAAHRLSTNSRKLRVDDVRHVLREPQLAKQLGRVEELFAQQKLQRMLRQQMVRCLCPASRGPAGILTVHHGQQDFSEGKLVAQMEDETKRGRKKARTE